MEYQKELIKHLWNRTDFDEEVISIQAFLKHYQMEEYQHLVCNRIIAAGLVDLVHVSIDVINPKDLIADWEGFIKCEDILSGYVDLDHVHEAQRLICSWHDRARSGDTWLSAWRKCSLIELVSLFMDGFKDRDLAELKGQAVAELLSRMWPNKIRVKLKDFALTWYVKMKYRRVFQWIDQSLKTESDSLSQ